MGHQIRLWSPSKNKENRNGILEAKAQRERIRELERDLKRKNAALAETVALLTLSKKAGAIWGDQES